MQRHRFLVRPPVGFASGAYALPPSTKLLRQLVPAMGPVETLSGVPVRVIASAASDGTKVVELTADEVALLQAQAPGVRSRRPSSSPV